jgi:hypothetical protein
MKNKKGFISTAVVYAFFLLFLILCLSLLSTYNHYRKTLTVEKNDIKTNLKLYTKSGILYEKILKDNGGTSLIDKKVKPDFKSVATTNEGMFSTPDNYGTSYYFRGAVDNNWVYFAGIYWRIIRINGDNSVRMIYSGTTAPIESEAVVMTGDKTEIGKYSYGEYSCNIGFENYESGPVGTILNEWYNNNLSSKYSKYISDSFFYAGYLEQRITTNDPIVGLSDAYIRLYWYNSPTLNLVSGFIKNIGLISADEIAFAGGNNIPQDSPHDSLDPSPYYNSYPNLNFYLYTNNSYWSMTNYRTVDFPYTDEIHSLWSCDKDMAFLLHSGGILFGDYKTSSYNVRPVISLKSTVTATGTGTWNDPYIVEE